jgi:hypothetical protein
MKKSNKWIEDDDEFVTDKRQMKKFTDRRKNKKLKNAIRNMNIDQLEEISEDDYYG